MIGGVGHSFLMEIEEKNASNERNVRRIRRVGHSFLWKQKKRVPVMNEMWGKSEELGILFYGNRRKECR